MINKNEQNSLPLLHNYPCLFRRLRLWYLVRSPSLVLGPVRHSKDNFRFQNRFPHGFRNWFGPFLGSCFFSQDKEFRGILGLVWGTIFFKNQISKDQKTLEPNLGEKFGGNFPKPLEGKG